MARPRKGSLGRLPNGEWRLRFPWGGNPQHVHRFGPESAGWTPEQAERERSFVIQQVRRGVYRPPGAPEPPPTARRAPAPTFAVAAANFMLRYRRRMENDATIADVERRLSWVMDIFGPVPVDAVDDGLALTYVDAILAERETIRAAAADGRPLTQEIRDSRGRVYEMRRRALSNTSINRGLDAAKMVLKECRALGQVAEVPTFKQARLKEPPPSRSFLEPLQIEYLLRAADELERQARGLTWEKVRYIRASPAPAVALARELHVSDVLIGKVRRGVVWNGEPGPRNRNDVPRRTPVLTFVLAGPRVSEGCGIDGVHLDLASHPGRLRIAGTKSSAGDRWVPLLPALRDALITHRADFPFGAGDPVFVTRNGRRNTPNNVRKTILNPAVARANELLEADGREPIAHLTPHSLRRTFASILAVCEISQRRAVTLVGHRDYELTARVYQQDIDLSDESMYALERVMGCSLDEAYELLGGRLGRARSRRVSVRNLYDYEKNPSTAAKASRAKG
jgi:integrase